ncbi:uncharacterized protein N7459_006719 [Penicillium hispanicum]|uniref:uncharacterized protein n=1 Tax=Penicillium hispanicum TaxID=1080232 RepID=UPI00254199DF|nr:uncharacterized protein N7459_006719 [Penicillium hispanicum]KAJ5577755.1 hypothetical protein N7459_006719 [Penicillium hispanicum]
MYPTCSVELPVSVNPFSSLPVADGVRVLIAVHNAEGTSPFGDPDGGTGEIWRLADVTATDWR